LDTDTERAAKNADLAKVQQQLDEITVKLNTRPLKNEVVIENNKKYD
jgi:hypothetical protein